VLQERIDALFDELAHWDGDVRGRRDLACDAFTLGPTSRVTRSRWGRHRV
jgi:hypothetical protein